MEPPSRRALPPEACAFGSAFIWYWALLYPLRRSRPPPPCRCTARSEWGGAPLTACPLKGPPPTTLCCRNRPRPRCPSTARSGWRRCCRACWPSSPTSTPPSTEVRNQPVSSGIGRQSASVLFRVGAELAPLACLPSSPTSTPSTEVRHSTDSAAALFLPTPWAGSQPSVLCSVGAELAPLASLPS